MKSSRMTPQDRALRKVTIDTRFIKSRVEQRNLTVDELGPSKYIPAGRLRNIPEGNR